MHKLEENSPETPIFIYEGGGDKKKNNRNRVLELSKHQ